MLLARESNFFLFSFLVEMQQLCSLGQRGAQLRVHRFKSKPHFKHSVQCHLASGSVLPSVALSRRSPILIVMPPNVFRAVLSYVYRLGTITRSFQRSQKGSTEDRNSSHFKGRSGTPSSPQNRLSEFYTCLLIRCI